LQYTKCHMNLDLENLWDNLWRDKEGRVVVWQTPNVFLIAWVVLTIVSLVVTGKAADIFSWLGLAALFIWSLLEIFKGVNYFRRILGLVVLVFAVLSLIKVV
jgi:hypothetical protein